MKALIREGVKDFYVRQKAIDILIEKKVRAKDYLREIKAVFEWVQRNVRYTKDPFRVEVLHAPRRMIELRAGDCDDMAILLGAMLRSIGHPVRLVLAGPDPLRPQLFTHVYLEVHHKGNWIPLDATMPYPMGWAPRVLVKKVLPV
jgi:transglutaminase-like putative cysteine protease